MTRREFCGWMGAATIAAARGGEDAPTTGEADPALKSFDDTMLAYMAGHGAPGGALAVVKDGRLVYARGYGWADVEARQAVQPDALFRIASISKPFTGVAVLALHQDPRRRLDLDAPAFPLLGLQPHLAPGAREDPRLNAITVRQLLHHTGGWDRDKSGDPMFMSARIAHDVGVPAPADQHAIIRWMMGRPLDFDPGARDCYSNFGYCVLGRVIEKVSGMPYETYVRGRVLAPAGITRMRLGRTQRKDRAEDEVRYYQGEALVNSVFPDARPRRVPWPYGGFDLEAMDSHGGWLASAVDLARFVAALDAPPLTGSKPLLNAEATRILHERPAPPADTDANGAPAAAYYACGWMVRPVGRAGKANCWHNGSLPGTYTLLVRRWDGLAWAALFNHRSDDPAKPDGALDGALHRAAAAVRRWPTHDLFSRYR